jgi:prepilin-type N-terminal cleavage/methylation domain-containing protein
MNIFKITKKKEEEGFTLVELLVVISIISLLTSIVLSSLNDARKKARDSARISTLQQVQKALAMYYSDNGYYPIGPNNLIQLKTALIPKYISEINSQIIYTGRNNLTNTAALTNSCTTGTGCPYYHLAIVLEDKNNQVTINDSDFITRYGTSLADFIVGTKTTCLGAGSLDTTNDYCFDIAQ